MHVQTQEDVLWFKRSDSGREHRRIGFYKFSRSGGLAQINNKHVVQVHKPPKRHKLLMASVSVTKRVFFRVFFLTAARTAVVVHKGQTGLWS